MNTESITTQRKFPVKMGKRKYPEKCKVNLKKDFASQMWKFV